MAEGQFDQAIENYNQVLAELPEEAAQDKAATLVQRAQAKFYRDQQKASRDSYNDIELALALVPQHRQGLGLAGILAYDLEDYSQALAHWKALWLIMAGSSEAQALESGIQKVAEKLREQGESVDLSWMKAIELKVLVQLAPHLQDQVSDKDAVFVLAKAVSGPVMPLAATRIMVTDLPAQISLTDAQGMVPGLSLSQMDEVQVIARVAKGGQPIAQPGDLQGIRSPVPTRSDKIIKLTIDQVVP
jgi:cytochrome c-type biogenesis protein CcmH